MRSKRKIKGRKRKTQQKERKREKTEGKKIEKKRKGKGKGFEGGKGKGREKKSSAYTFSLERSRGLRPFWNFQGQQINVPLQIGQSPMFTSSERNKIECINHQEHIVEVICLILSRQTSTRYILVHQATSLSQQIHNLPLKSRNRPQLEMSEIWLYFVIHQRVSSSSLSPISSGNPPPF